MSYMVHWRQVRVPAMKILGPRPLVRPLSPILLKIFLALFFDLFMIVNITSAGWVKIIAPNTPEENADAAVTLNYVDLL